MSFKDLWRILRKKPVLSTTESQSDIERKKELNLQERQLEIEMRRMELDELKRAQRRNTFEEFKENLENNYDDGEEEDSEIGQIIGAVPSILSMIKGGQGSSDVQQTTSSNHPAPNPHLSDEEIKEFINKQDKKKIKFAKTLPKGILKSQLTKNFGLSDADSERAYEILQEV
jgi:hypothetical protein